MTRADLDALILQALERTQDAEALELVGGWVALAEADIRQRLRAPWMIRVATGSVDDITTPLDFSSPDVEEQVRRIPDTYVQAAGCYLWRGEAGSGAREVEFLAPSQLGPYLNAPGEPRYVCIEGHYMQFLPGSGAVKFRLSYYSTGTPLDKPTATNENLARAANVYLYSALHHAAIFYGAEDRANSWGGKADQMIENINNVADEWGGGTGYRIRRRRR